MACAESCRTLLQLILMDEFLSPGGRVRVHLLEQAEAVSYIFKQMGGGQNSVFMKINISASGWGGEGGGLRPRPLPRPLLSHFHFLFFQSLKQLSFCFITGGGGGSSYSSVAA